jgi:tRNA-splicing ligase RtcB
MARLRLQGKDLRRLGYPEGKVVSIAIQVMERNFKHHSKYEALEVLEKVLANPQEYLSDSILGKIADALVEKEPHTDEHALSAEKRGYAVFGAEQIEDGARSQMNTAIRLPVSVAGALMPDAHQGYGLPIGGVLATDNAVIPYGVGVDIGCRMCLTVFDMPARAFERLSQPLRRSLIDNTVFGAGGTTGGFTHHEVMEREEFRTVPMLRHLKDKAGRQLGTSGSGNHFVEFGIVTINEAGHASGLPPGEYVALLSHSGSRALGATVAGHFTQLAMKKTMLPKEAKHLAWLSLDTHEGQEYWAAMNLAGDYASACHHHIHERIIRAAGLEPLARVENHHNFAWKEIHNGRELIVHRKGATPASENTLGIIPGSMATPGFIVRGKGDPASLFSAAHGAGRRMSRTEATKRITVHSMKEMLADHGIQLIGGAADEAPQAYKDIHEVMRAQENLVEVIGTFVPKIVRMDGK